MVRDTLRGLSPAAGAPTTTPLPQASTAAAAVETAFAELPLPLSERALEAAVADAKISHVRNWQSAFGAYRGCDEFRAADSVLTSTFQAAAESVGARNAAARAGVIQRALKAAVGSFQAALSDAASPMSARP